MSSNVNRRRFLEKSALAGVAATMIPDVPVSAQDKKVVLALVGCAHIHTPGFVKLLKARQDVKVKYVWDHDEARATQRAGELEGEKTPDLAKVWGDPEVRGVVICSETNRHTDLVLAAASAQKHMFVEKPLGIDVRDCFRMVSAIEKARLGFTTGYFNRTLPAHLFLKEQIALGSFGQITRVRGSNCHSGSLGGWFDKEWRWMADPKIAGVGAFGDLGTHLLDILMWLLGEVSLVSADIKEVTRRYGDCDESGEALLKFKNGVTGTLAAGWVDVADPVTLQISGTQGHAMILNGELYFKSEKVEGADGRKPWRQLPKPLAAPLDQFVDALSGKPATFLVTPREAADRVSVMQALYQASAKKKWAAPLHYEYLNPGYSPVWFGAP
jgi:predicted dehydrogenase